MAGVKFWHRNKYDHIIRDQKDYASTWEYIDTNPLRWKDDHNIIPDGKS